MKMTIEEAKEYGWGDKAEKFVNWRNEVEEHCIKLFGADLDSLPDFDFASAFENRVSPKTTAKKVIRNAMGY